jgi:hypothetical protein
MQAILLLFLITPMGVLGTWAMISEGKYGLTALFSFLTFSAATLGVWLLRKNPPPPPPTRRSGPPPIIGRTPKAK